MLEGFPRSLFLLAFLCERILYEDQAGRRDDEREDPG
jgi:hypothetical protein